MGPRPPRGDEAKPLEPLGNSLSKLFIGHVGELNWTAALPGALNRGETRSIIRGSPGSRIDTLGERRHMSIDRFPSADSKQELVRQQA